MELLNTVWSFLTAIHWSSVAQIIMIDILLGGDNAVVIAMACRNLPDSQRTKGVIFGAGGAILLRVALITCAVFLLELPFLKVCGGLLLLWIGYKLVATKDEDGPENVEGSSKLLGAIKTVIVADLVMSIDNIIAIAGAAEQAPAAHQTALIVMGLLVSVPFIICGSQLLMKLFDRFPWIITLGGGLLGWIAGTLAVSDPWIVARIGEPAWLHYASGIACAVAVIVAGKMFPRTGD